MLKSLLLSLLLVANCSTGIGDIEAFLRSLLTQPETVPVPKIDELARLLFSNNDLREAPIEQLERLLPLAQSCLKSANPAIRTDGMMIFSAIATARLDNATLLAPYSADLATFFTDSETGLKPAAISVLASGYPKPSGAGVAYLIPQLDDERNTDSEFMMIAGALLIDAPSRCDSVLKSLARRQDADRLKGAMIQELGILKNTTKASLDFLKSGLRDKNPEVRRVTVEAITHLPNDERRGFIPDMQRLLAGSDELPETLAWARKILAP